MSEVKVVYHHVINGTIWDERFKPDGQPPILPSPGDLVNIEHKGERIISAQMVTDRVFTYDADTGNVKFEIVLQDPAEVREHIEQE